jgi:hypothetical protein
MYPTLAINTEETEPLTAPSAPVYDHASLSAPLPSIQLGPLAMVIHHAVSQPFGLTSLSEHVPQMPQ